MKEFLDQYCEHSLGYPREPYPGMPRYMGDLLDAYLLRPWGWSEPVMQQRYFKKKEKQDRVRKFVENLKK